MNAGARQHGFTLLEVLVALALVASALGGTLMVVREAARTQHYLERRLFAQWVADNALNQYILEARHGTELARSGREVMLGRVYEYTIAVRPLDASATLGERPDAPAAGGGEGAAPRAPAALSEVAVEVRDAASRHDALSRRVRRVALAGGA